MTSQDIDLSRAVWRKSSYSGGNGGQCVEVATNLPGIVAVRDSKNPDGLKLIFTPDEWTAFLAGVRDGEFEGSTGSTSDWSDTLSSATVLPVARRTRISTSTSA